MWCRSPFRPASRFLRLGCALAAIALLAPRVASAQGGINLSWEDCSIFGRAQRNFSCSTNAGSATLVLSAFAPAPMSHLVGMRAVVKIFASAAPLSPWWRFDPAGCRAGSLTASFDFTRGPQQGCVDPWQGAAAGGFTYLPDVEPGAAIVTLACGIAGEVPTDGTEELDLARLTIDYARSAGADSCAGCSGGACIVFLCAQLLQPAGMPSYILSNPVLRDYVGFQAASMSGPYLGCPPVGSGDLWACPGAVPARRPTWGQIKALSR